MNATKAPSETSSKSRSTKIWITLSFVLSIALLVWSFTLPFRESSSLIPSRGADGDRVVSASVVQYRNADELRAEAMMLDHDLMEMMREKEQERSRPRPGIREVKQRWELHVQDVKRQIKEMGAVKEGSIEAQHRKEMLESLEDAPRE